MNRGSIQTGIWLIGLGILFLTGRFWPEILIVIGLSMLATALVPKTRPRRSRSGRSALSGDTDLAEPIVDYDDEDDHLPPALGSEYAAPSNQFDTSKIPSECPMCGGPVLSNQPDLTWVGRSKVLCPYCATQLPMQKKQLPNGKLVMEGEAPYEK